MIRYTGRQRAYWSWIIASLIGVWLIGILGASAQDSGTTINVGENKTGDLSTSTSGSLSYTLAVSAAQSVTILVLGVTPGYAPAIRVHDPSGAVILDDTNADARTSLQAQADLPGAGTYTLEVRSATQTVGQFVLSLQAGSAPVPAVALTAGTPVSGTVDDQTTKQVYSFGASPSDVLLLTISGDGSVSGPIVTLRDADTRATLGVSSPRFSSVGYRVPASSSQYLVEVSHSDGATAEGFVVCLSVLDGSTPCSGAPVPPESTPELSDLVATEAPTVTDVSVSATCQAAATGPTVNVRAGPGTGAGVVGRLSAGVTAAVTGRTPNNSWIQINLDGLIGWVSASVVTLTGDCGSVDIINAPLILPPPPVQPTNPPPVQAPPTSAPPVNVPPTKEPKPTEAPPTIDPNLPTATRRPILVSTVATGGLESRSIQRP